MKKIIILLICACLVGVLTNREDYVKIPSSSIRMRVIAKSNSEEDQKDKIIIKSAVEEKLYELTKNAKNVDEVDTIIEQNEKEVNKAIQDTIDKNHIETSFISNYGYNYFPQKEFKGVSYPAGLYKSIVVTLGEGDGENWWCVLYPPLCLVDEKAADYEYHSLIKDTLDKYN